MNMTVSDDLMGSPISPAPSSWGAGQYARFVPNRISELPDISGGKSWGRPRPPENATLAEGLALRLLSFKRMTSPISRYLDRSWHAQLFERLDILFDAEDWDDDFVLPLEASFETFLRLIIYLHPTTRPGIGLSSRGYILASWSKDGDRIVIECLPKDELRWVLSQTNEDRRESAAGKNRIQRLVELIEGYEPDRFFKNGHKVTA
jgi:hypothetical protein